LYDNKLLARQILDETMGYVPYIYINLPINQVSTQTLQRTMDYTYTGSNGKWGSYIVSIPRY